MSCSLPLAGRTTRVLPRRRCRLADRRRQKPRARRFASRPRLSHQVANLCSQHRCGRSNSTVSLARLVTSRCGRGRGGRTIAAKSSLRARHRSPATTRVLLAPRRHQQRSATGVSADVLQARSQALFSGPGVAHSPGLAGRWTRGHSYEAHRLLGGRRSRRRCAAAQQVMRWVPMVVSLVAYALHRSQRQRLTTRSWQQLR